MFGNPMVVPIYLFIQKIPIKPYALLIGDPPVVLLLIIINQWSLAGIMWPFRAEYSPPLEKHLIQMLLELYYFHVVTYFQWLSTALHVHG